jgi:hypothetical protein
MRTSRRGAISIRSIFMSSTAIGLIAASGIQPSAAGEPAVSGMNAKIAAIGGVADMDDVSSEEIGLVTGSVTVPLGHAYGLQIDGLAGDHGGDFVGGVGGHLFWRDPTVGLLGLTGAYAASDSGSFSSSTVVTTVGLTTTTTVTTATTSDREIVRLGGEGEYYFGSVTLGGNAGYQFGQGIENGFYGIASLRGYLTDDLALAVSAHYAEGSGASVSVGAEFQPGLGGLPGLAVFADATAGRDDFMQALFGIRYYFGAPKSLIDRHRRDDPTANLIQDAVATSLVPVTTSSTSSSVTICFVAGTQILMADGSLKAIEAIVAGDCVLGADSEINKVLDIETPLLGNRPLYSFNGGRAFVTHDHPLMTADGWKAIDPGTARFAHPGAPRVGALAVGDRLVILAGVTRCAIPVAVGADHGAPAYETVCETALIRIETISAHDSDPAQQVYNLKLEGNHTYFADGYLAHNR